MNCNNCVKGITKIFYSHSIFILNFKTLNTNTILTIAQPLTCFPKG